MPPVQTVFDTTVLGLGNNTGIEVPEANVAALGKGKRPPVTVDVNGYRYSSTVAVMGGRNLIPLAKAHREAAGLSAGDPITVTLVLDDAPRTVEVPAPLQEALERAGLAAAFEALSFTKRKEFARSVAEAKADDTRQRRIDKVLDSLS